MSALSARDLIASSLRLLGVLASGEALGASEATDGLASLNDLLDSWSTDNLLIPNKVRESFALVGSQQTYTMGTGGNFNTARPMRIENALIQVSASPQTEIPMRILTKDEYAGIILKQSASTFPLYLHSDNAFPLATLSVWPVPTSTDNLVLYSWKALAELATLSAVLSLPPGYQRALRYSLAIELAPEYGKSAPAEIVGIAEASVAHIKRMNFTPKYLYVDDALRAKPAVWNWMTGEPT